MQRFVSAFAACAIACTATAQLSVVIPAGYDTQVENSANVFPYGTGASAWPGLRIQHVYDSTHFTGQNISSPIIISGLRWRAAAGTATWSGGTYTPATVALSTAAVDYLATTTNYATNHGPDLTQVFSGTVTVQPGTGNGAGIIGPWHVDVQFQTPFLYDPSNGDLCIDCDVVLPGIGGFTALASCTSAAPIPTLARRVYASSMYPNANGVDQNILVCEIQYVPASGFAYSSSYGQGCLDRASASFYELFANATFDLANTSWQMIPTGNGYAVLPAAPAWFTPTNAVTLSDDSVSAAQPLGFTLNYPGGTTTDVYISSNGFVWAQSSSDNGCCNGAPASLLANGARWCPLWNDLNPGAGGAVYFDTDPANGAAYVTFDQVPEFGTTNPNSFQVAFFNNGSVEIRFGACSVLNHQVLTGWSPGNGSQDPGSIDLSAASILLTEPDLSAIRHGASARPVIGTSINLETTNVPPAGIIGATLFGLTEINPGLSLASIGMPGCFQYVSIDASQVWIPAAGVGSTAFNVPNNTAFAGIEIKTQGAALVPGINTVGALTTNGLKHVLDVN